MALRAAAGGANGRLLCPGDREGVRKPSRGVSRGGGSEEGLTSTHRLCRSLAQWHGSVLAGGGPLGRVGPQAAPLPGRHRGVDFWWVRGCRIRPSPWVRRQLGPHRARWHRGGEGCSAVGWCHRSAGPSPALRRTWGCLGLCRPLPFTEKGVLRDFACATPWGSFASL